MIKEVVKQWLTRLDPLEASGLLTAKYGLTRPARIRVSNDRDYVIPALLDADNDQVFDTVYDGLLLNKDQRSVLFVEGDQTRTEKRGNAHIEVLPVRVILWFNKDGYQTNSGNVSTKFQAAIMGLLNQKQPGNFGSFQNIAFERTNIVEGWKAFSKYTFLEETGYLFSPYESIGIDGNLTFYVNENNSCESVLLPGPFGSDC